MADEKRQMDVFQVMARFDQLQRLMAEAGRLADEPRTEPNKKEQQTPSQQAKTD